MQLSVTSFIKRHITVETERLVCDRIDCTTAWYVLINAYLLQIYVFVVALSFHVGISYSWDFAENMWIFNHMTFLGQK